MKKRLLFLITKSYWGGAQKYVYQLALAFRDTYEVTVAFGGGGVLGNEPPGPLKSKLEAAGMRTIFIPELVRDVHHFHELRSVVALWKLFKKEQPHIVHLNSSKAGGEGAFAARLAGVSRIVFTSHGLATDEDRDVFSRTLIWLSTWATFLLSHRVVTISQDTHARARRFPGCAGRIRLVYNSAPQVTLLPRSEARQKLGLPETGIVIGSIGELVYNKRYDTLLTAASSMQKRDLSICLIGDGEERASLEGHAKKLSPDTRVVFAGYVSQAASYLSAFDIFVLPSKKEGLPYVLLEAGAAGLPCLASRIPGITDIITDNESGLLFDFGNMEVFREKLEKLLEDTGLRRRLGEALKNRTMTLFSESEMYRGTQEVYEQ